MADSKLILDVPLHEATESRYLNYAMSVIMARALPDVRDGLKPVQRRILYAMFHNLNLTADAKHRKSAAVVGEVMAKYHPHGDASIYDAMVRMAQDFSLRYPLIDGQGNFGSIDGDGAAAMRYTEAKLRHIAQELLAELKRDTVPMRANYDGTIQEPTVLPAQFPNLLVNGASGIAVGMATNIPPHNLGEVTGALLALIDDPTLSLETIVHDHIPAPDFPSGGQILNTPEELLEIYRTGAGPVEMRGTWRVETEGRKRQIIVDSIPWGINKASLIGDIADHIRAGKLPQIVDIRDESTEDIRIVMELGRDASEDAAMAFLCRRTDLQCRFAVNMTALVPVHPNLEHDEMMPRRLDLRDMLERFLEFRYHVTERRLEHDLRELQRRIHILQGFEVLFDALDEAIALIRASSGKADAARRLMERFPLDAEQTDAILELRLYRLARLEIDIIRKELAEKRALAHDIQATLNDAARMWALIRSELVQIRDAYGQDRRRSSVVGPPAAVTFEETAYIVAEETHVIITRDGWFKRQKSYTDLAAIRVREGDGIGWVLPASTRETLVLCTDRGRAYTLRIDAIPLTTGYGEPISARFSFADGEHIVGVACSDARCLPDPALLAPPDGEDPPPPYLVALSRMGKAVRVPLASFLEPSTVQGRTLMRLDAEATQDGVVLASLSDGHEVVSLASRQGRCINFPVADINVLSGVGKGVAALKLTGEDRVLGATLCRHRDDGLTVETNRGRIDTVRPSRYAVVRRGNRGHELLRTGYIARIHTEPVVFPLPPTDTASLDRPPRRRAGPAPPQGSLL